MLVQSAIILTRKKLQRRRNVFIFNQLSNWRENSRLFLIFVLDKIEKPCYINFMSEKIVKSGIVNRNFYLWMEATFGFDCGIFILIPTWHGRNHPCKFHPKTLSICDGYSGNESWVVEEDAYWEITQDDEYFMLKIWDKDYPKGEYLPTHHYLIEKCINLPRIEQLEMEVYGL